MFMSQNPKASLPDLDSSPLLLTVPASQPSSLLLTVLASQPSSVSPCLEDGFCHHGCSGWKVEDEAWFVGSQNLFYHHCSSSSRDHLSSTPHLRDSRAPLRKLSSDSFHTCLLTVTTPALPPTHCPPSLLKLRTPRLQQLTIFSSGSKSSHLGKAIVNLSWH